MKAMWRAAILVAALVVSVVEAQAVRWAESGDPNTMDPHCQNVGTVTMVAQQIYDARIGRSQQPGLATAWTQEEATRGRFTQRPDIRVHDGVTFTSDDVVS